MSSLQARGVHGKEARPDGVEVSVADTPSGRVVTLTIEGCLDEDTAATLLEVTKAVVAEGVARLDLDLRSLEAFTVGGATALVICRELCARLHGGLHYRTGSGPGREALLTAYADRG